MRTGANRKHQSSLECSLRAVAGVITSILLVPLAVPGEGVVTECTEANLRAAMAGGGAVTFACNGTITLAATITISIDTALDGSGRQITISSGNAVRVFFVPTNVTLDAVNLSVANGLSTKGGGLYNDGGFVTVSNCAFSGNRAAGPAGSGNLSSQMRVEGINAFGPPDAWFTLDTVTLTNTSQYYFDVTAPGQPQRLYRLVPLP
jgi:hypothetical protein